MGRLSPSCANHRAYCATGCHNIARASVKMYRFNIPSSHLLGARFQHVVLDERDAQLRPEQHNRRAR